MVGSASNKGKFGKARRGGGRHFTSVRELSGKGKEEEGLWRDKNAQEDSEDDSEEEDESSSEEEQDYRRANSHSLNAPERPPKLDENGEIMRDKLGNIILQDAPSDSTELSRAERKALKAQQKGKSVTIQPGAPSVRTIDARGQEEEEDDLVQIDNTANSKNVKMKDLAKTAPASSSSAGETQALSRRQREEKQKLEAKKRYQQLTMEGKTDQAKADLARLKKIREDREKAAAAKKLESERKEKEAQATLEDSGRKRTTR